MTFAVEVSGGFVSSGISLTQDTGTTTLLPVSMGLVPFFGQIGVVDSQNRGLIMVDLRTAGVAATFF